MINDIQQVERLFHQQLTPGFAFNTKVNKWGVATAWVRLSGSDQLLPAAQAIRALGGRLHTISAYQRVEGKPSEIHEIAWHFDLDGSTLTMTLRLAEGERDLPSLTPVFRNADWNEREFMELYDLNAVGHPNPTRLFIDENIDAAVLQKYIPFSDMVNAASTKALWEKIMQQRGENQ
nr:NADH-quinone oxidoreductase subunit C [uncultured Enterobacter sp.]